VKISLDIQVRANLAMTESIQVHLPVDLNTFVEWARGRLVRLTEERRPYKDGYAQFFFGGFQHENFEDSKIVLNQNFAIAKYTDKLKQEDPERQEHPKLQEVEVTERIDGILTLEASEEPNVDGTMGVIVKCSHNIETDRYWYDYMVRLIARKWPEAGLTTLGMPTKKRGAKRNLVTDWVYCQVKYENRPYEDVLHDLRELGYYKEQRSDKVVIARLKEQVGGKKNHPSRGVEKPKRFQPETKYDTWESERE
jgi:hypothetical protein